ncbi:MAG: YaaA family protein, partial [Erysipelotrichaceae bacterium]|nr:YaaA family protein [Erysipelotrichaceae bacterium]
MLVLLSPTKTMKKMAYKGKSSVPFFEDHATMIANQFQPLDVRQLQMWYNVSDNIAQQAYSNWQTFDTQSKTIALLAYQGEAFRNLDATTLTRPQIEKVNKHLRILSALYGILRPLDEIVSYRLDF